MKPAFLFFVMVYHVHSTRDSWLLLALGTIISWGSSFIFQMHFSNGKLQYSLILKGTSIPHTTI